MVNPALGAPTLAGELIHWQRSGYLPNASSAARPLLPPPSVPDLGGHVRQDIPPVETDPVHHVVTSIRPAFLSSVQKPVSDGTAS